MDRRSPNAAVVTRIKDLATVTGCTLESVAEATDVPVSKIAGHPSAGELTFSDLVSVGGFLRVRPDYFFKGVAA